LKSGAEIHGVDPLLAAFKDLKESIRKRILRKAMAQGAEIYVEAVKARAPVAKESAVPGLYQRSIGTVGKSKKGILTFLIGPRRGFKVQIGVSSRGKRKGKPMYQTPTKIAHLLEFGTSRSKPKPHLRPALDEVTPHVERAVVDELRRGVEKSAARAAKAAARVAAKAAVK
jgi:HK97 gp10 family phage protein